MRLRANAVRWGAKQQTVLRGDISRYGLRPDAIALLPQAHGPHDVDGHRTVDPPRQSPGIAGREVVTARQHRDPRPRGHGPMQHPVGEAPTRVTRHHDVGVDNLSLLQRGRAEDQKGGDMAGKYPKVQYTEQGMREGMQIEDANISIDDKVALLDMSL